MNRLNQLMQQHADSGARSDIECYAQPADPKKLGPWYIAKSADPEMQQAIDDAVEYLTLRGLIARHPDHDWVTVNIVQPIVFSR